MTYNARSSDFSSAARNSTARQANQAVATPILPSSTQRAVQTPLVEKKKRKTGNGRDRARLRVAPAVGSDRGTFADASSHGHSLRLAGSSDAATLRPAVRQALSNAAMEALEGREMMSATIGLNQGVLTLRADALTASTMRVDVEHNGQDLVAHLTGAKPQDFPIADVSSIAMIGSSVGDHMILGKAVKLPSVINGGLGDNTIIGGSGNDDITAGNGNNVINGRGGNDKITVGSGNNIVRGGADNDTLIAGSGTDILRGNSGNDSLVGGTGADQLFGGTGDDTIVAGVGENRIADRTGDNTILRNSTTRVAANRISKIADAPNARPIVGGAWGGPTKSTGGGNSSGTSSGSKGTPSVGSGNSHPGTGGSGAGASGTGNSNAGGTNAGAGGSNANSGGTSSGSGASSSGGNHSGGSNSGSNSGGSNSGGSKPGSSSGGTTSGGTTSGGTTSGGSNSGGSNSGGSNSGGSNSGGSNSGGSNSGGSNSGSSGGSSSSPGGTVTPSSGSAPLFAVQTNQGSADPGNISFSASHTQANIQVAFASGMANHTVHFNGLGSKFASGDALDATWLWNFGDPSSRFNTLHGWIGAHTYDKAGVYTVTLTVTDKSGKSSTVSTTVTIAADTRRSIYVDTLNGSDTNTGATPAAAIASLARASELLGDNTRILLHNGQTFDVANTVFINNSNVLIGTYGTGAAPRVVKRSGSGSSIFNIGANAQNVVAQGMVLDSQWTIANNGEKKVNVYGFYVTGDNFTVRDCQFLNVDDGVNTAGMPTGVLVQDNYFGTMIRGCCIWGQGYDHVYLGNTMTNSYQEHLIRMSGTGVCRVLIEANNLSRFTPIKGSLELRTSSFFYVTGNVVNGGTLRLGLPDGETDYFTGWGVVQQNETSKIFANIRPGAQHILLRNNVFHFDDAGPMIVIQPQYSVGHRVISDIRIDHNTLIDGSQQAKFLKVDGTGVQNISVTNNLMIAPNIAYVGVGAGGIYVADKDLSAFSNITGNIWPAQPANSTQPGENYVYPVWGQVGAVSGFVTNDDWNKMPQVGTDQFANEPTPTKDVYSVTLNGVTAGALAGKFDPHAWSMAAAA